jgi:hypothetical protein
MDAKSIKEFLKDKLTEERPTTFYQYIAHDFKGKNFSAIDTYLKPFLRPEKERRLDVRAYLDRYQNNTEQPLDMPLIERERDRERLANLLKSNQTEKTRIISLYSCRGMGKTSLLRSVAGNELREWTAAGRVIVRDCGKSALEEWWKLAEKDPRQSVCSLIEAHLNEIIGARHKESKRSPNRRPCPRDAYADWITRTEQHFGLTPEQSKKLCPIIILDTCEGFGDKVFKNRKQLGFSG